MWQQTNAGIPTLSHEWFNMNRIWVATCIINASLVWKNMCYAHKHSYIYIIYDILPFQQVGYL